MLSSRFEGVQPDPYARRKLLEPPAQRLHQHQLPRFARGDREVARGLGRIERLARPQQTFHAGENDVDGGRKLERLRRRHEPLARAHEQLVGEDLAELRQRMADRRGAPSEPLGGAGDAGVDEQGVERHEQIGVDFP